MNSVERDTRFTDRQAIHSTSKGQQTVGTPSGWCTVFYPSININLLEPMDIMIRGNRGTAVANDKHVDKLVVQDELESFVQSYGIQTVLRQGGFIVNPAR